VTLNGIYVLLEPTSSDVVQKL